MDDNLTTSRKPTPRTLALGVSALVLCTAGGAVGGLALSSAFQSRSAVNNTSAAGGYALEVPGSNRYYPRTFDGPAVTPSTTSAASKKQLVGLVRIQTTLGYQNGVAVGTGMIVNSDGEVVTNHHVIEGATKITVTVMSTGRQYQASLVGSDASDDIAVLRLVGASGLSTVDTSTSAASVGQAVTAVGDAQGASDFTSSPGKVTAVNQTISPSDGAQTETLTGVIQYAAEVMSGDSGGATYDSAGKVVGMTTAASTGGAQTNGYAIPISKVLSVVSDLERHASNAKYTYGLPSFIGVGVNQNAVVERVFAGTGAAKSGLVAGDRIVAVDGTSIASSAQLQAATRRHHAGQTIRVTWTTSSGQQQSATIRLIPGPAA